MYSGYQPVNFARFHIKLKDETMTKNTKITTPAELNAIFAIGAYKRAVHSAIVLDGYLAKRKNGVVFGTCNSPADREIIANAGYKQSTQTLSQWATVAGILSLMGTSKLTELQLDAFAEYVHTAVQGVTSVSKRQALAEEFRTMSGKDIAQALEQYEATKGKRVGGKKMTPPKNSSGKKVTGKKEVQSETPKTGKDTPTPKQVFADLETILGNGSLEEITTSELDSYRAVFAKLEELFNPELDM